MNRITKVGLGIFGGLAMAVAVAFPANAADVAFDYSDYNTSIFTVLGGLAVALGGVLSAALLIRAITWGVPKLVRFFVRLAG